MRRFQRWFFSTLWRCPCGCNCGSCREGRHRGRTFGWTVPNLKLSVKRAFTSPGRPIVLSSEEGAEYQRGLTAGV